MTANARGPVRTLLLALLLSAGCGGGAEVPNPPEGPPPTVPAEEGKPPPSPDRPPPPAEPDEPPEAPILPFPAPGEDPDFPAKTPPGPGDWLAAFDEPGQTVEEYRLSCTNRLIGRRRRILVQPLGELAAERPGVLEAVRAHLEAFFDGAEVVLAEPLPLPEGAWNGKRGQWFGPDLLRDLGNRLEGTTLACLGLCGGDLYAEDLNFVFGLASPRIRTGVFSLARYGGGGEKAFLRRSLKVAAHETGHLLGLEHCIRYECLMNGSNSLPETDRSPLHACPECREKLRWNLRFDPAERWGRLARFFAAAGLEEAARFSRRQAGKSRTR